MKAMETNPKIENYLTILERSLKQLPVSERAEIVTEIKSHILSALEREPGGSVENVLHALGEPETVANRYLAERGHAFVKPSISPIVKWLVIGFLGTFGLLLFFVGALAFRFSPLVHIDGEKERVTLLGGMVDIDGVKETVRIGGLQVSDDDEGSGWRWSGTKTRQVIGKKLVATGSDTTLMISAANAKLQIGNSTQGEFSWDCHIEKDKPDPVVSEKGHQLVFDLTSLMGVKCELLVPEKHALSIRVRNGKVDIAKPRSNLDVSVTNGKLSLDPDPALKYRYDLQITNGKKDAFESSDSPDALLIRADVSNGKITHLNKED
jgi:hypothetical protein